MKYFVFYILSLISTITNCICQEENVVVLIEKGNTNFEKNDFERASYYYQLALKYTDDIKQISDIKTSILNAEKLLAYSSSDENYVELLCRADSLSTCCDLLALKTFQEAYNLNPSCSYPSMKMDSIFNSSEEIKKKLLVIAASRKRKQYTDDLNIATFYLESGKYLEAYRLYEKINIFYPEDTISKPKMDTVFPLVKDDLEEMNKNVEKATKHYKKGNYDKATPLFEKVLTIDPNCSYCRIKLSSIDYILNKMQKEDKYETVLKNAEENYYLGNYELAQFEYNWLYKQSPENKGFEMRLLEISKNVDEEFDSKKATMNANNLLQKADSYFLHGEYSRAHEYYVILSNRYKNLVSDYLYILERIKDCNHLIEINNSH